MVNDYLLESISLLQSLYKKVAKLNIGSGDKSLLMAADDETGATEETTDTLETNEEAPSPEDTLGGGATSDDTENETAANVKADTKELFALNTIFSIIKYLEGVLETIRKVTNNEKLLTFSFKLQELKQIFFDFVDNIELYEEEEQKEIIRKLQAALLKYMKLFMNYLKEEF